MTKEELKLLINNGLDFCKHGGCRECSIAKRDDAISVCELVTKCMPLIYYKDRKKFLENHPMLVLEKVTK